MTTKNVLPPTDTSVGGNTTAGVVKPPAANDAAALANALGISLDAANKAIEKYGDAQSAYDALYGTTSGTTPPVGDGGGSSSGSSSGGGSAGPSPQDIANAVESYVTTFSQWGIPVDAKIRNWLKQQVVKGYTSAAIMAAFRKTKDYARAFPGIVRKNGTLRMTESQYISGFNQANDYASTVGRNFGKQAYGMALENGNSPSEIKAKIAAVDALKSYGPQLDEFNDYLVTTGVAKKPLSRKELLEFVMKKGPKQFETAWETANTAYKLQELAGVNVDKPKQGGDESYKELRGQIDRFQSLGGDLDQVDFAKMGALISEVIPKNELYGQGIRKRDIVEMMLNGKNAGAITKRVQTVLDTYQAAVTEPGAQPQNYAGKPLTSTPRAGSE